MNRNNITSKTNVILLFVILLSIQFANTQILALLCIFAVFIINTLNKVNRKYRKTTLFLLYSLVAFVVYMSRPPYIYNMVGQMEAFWLLVGIIILIAMLQAEIPEKKILSMVILTSIIGGSLTLIAYFSNYYFFNLISPPYAGTRAVGGFDGPNELASFHVLVISICFGIIVDNKMKFNMFFLISTIIISSTVVFFSFSRGGIVGLAVAVAIFFFFYFRKKFVKFFLYLIPLSTILYLVLNKYKQQIIGTFFSVRRNKSERGYLTAEVIDIFSEKPFLGWGLGAFSSIANVRNTVPHNDFYVFLVSGGTLGLLFFVVFLICLIFKSIKLQHYSITFFMIVFITQALTFNHLIRGRISLLFWVVISIILYSRETSKGDYIGSHEIKFRNRKRAEKSREMVRPL